jgi:hypothetical protein
MLMTSLLFILIVSTNHVHMSRALALDIDRATGAPRAQGDFNRDGTPRSKL